MTTERKCPDCGCCCDYDIYAGAALYLTNDMLKNLKTSN